MCGSQERPGQRLRFLNRVLNHNNFNHVFNESVDKSSFKVIYTNCDSLMNKKLELECVVEIQQPKVILVSEILPKNSQNALDKVEFQLEGYESFIPSLSIGRGVAIYVHESLSAAGVDLLNNYVYQESVWCEIKLQGTDKLLVGCIYRSPGKSSKENNNLLNCLLRKASNFNYSHVLVAGDFNYKSINWMNMSCNQSIESDASLFLEAVKDTYFTQHIHQPTRYRESEQENILDLVFTNEERMTDNISYTPGLGKSDHCIISFDYMCYTDPSQSGSQRLNYFKGDYFAIREWLGLERCTRVSRWFLGLILREINQ